MLRKAVILLWVVGLLLAPAAKASSGADPVIHDWPGWPYRVSCLTGSFDPIATFSAPARAERGGQGSARSLRRFLKTGLLPWLPRHDWRLAVEKPRELQFLHGHPGAGLESGDELEWLRLRRSRGRWRMVNYSSWCPLISVEKGEWATTWFLAENQPELTPDTQRINVYVGVRCSKNDNPAALAEAPQFHEISGKLVMTIWLRPDPSPSDGICEEGLGPGPSLTVELPEPLGDRELVDGGTFPPTPAMHLEKPQVTFGRSAFLRQ
jgi:hypothetical protein